MSKDEKIARAIFECVHGDSNDTFDGTNDNVRSSYNQMSRAAIRAMNEWFPIETAPKDGTRILAYGLMVPDCPTIVWDERVTLIPAQMVIWWIEGWYDRDEHVGDGLFKKVPTRGYAYWRPEPQQFKPTHWMHLPDGPK